MKRITAATMVYAAGDTGRTVFHVYRATLHGRIRQWWDLNASDSDHVGTLAYNRGDVRPSRYAMAAQFATPDAPAFDFGRS